MRSFLLCFIVLCTSCINEVLVAQDLARIALQVVEKDTGFPLEQAKVEILSASVGNYLHVNGRTPIGSTDECGYFSALAPVDLARYSAHGNPVTNTFILAVTHCLYGQAIVYYKIGDKYKEVSLKKPLIYDLKAFTDASKSFIRLEWKSNKNDVLFIEGSMYPGVIEGNATRLWKVGSNISYHEDDYAPDALISYTDYEVEKGKSYTYIVAGQGDARSLSPGCDVLQDMVTIDLSDATPEMISFLPLVSEPCPVITGTESLVQSGVRVYPNPYHDKLAVKFDESFQGPLTLSIVDILGRELYVSRDATLTGERQFSLALDELPPGVQLLKVSGPRKSLTYRIVKAE
jgi:hypothetical protein